MITHRKSHSKRRAGFGLLATTVALGSVVALAGGNSPVSAAGVQVDFVMAGEMSIGATTLPLPDGSLWSGTIDREAGTISAGASTIPDIVLPATESLPIEVTVRISDLQASTGTISETGVVTLDVKYQVELIGLGCTISPINISLASLEGAELPVDNSMTSVSADGFTVPALAAPCPDPISGPANTQLGLPSTATAINLVLTKAAKPEVVRTLAAVPGNGQVALSWKSPAGSTNPAIDEYKVEYRKGTGSWQNKGTTTSTSSTVTGLTNGGKYEFRVSAKNALGAGPTVSVKATPFTSPGAPRSITTTRKVKSILVGWKPPTSDGGSAITGYKVIASPGGESCLAKASERSCTVTKLKSGKAYTFSVRAKNAAGYGSPAKSASVKPK